MIIKTGARAAVEKSTPPVVANTHYEPPPKVARPAAIDLNGSTLEVIEVEQGTDEWHEVRRGILTASAAKALITAGGKVSQSEGARSLMRHLVAERITDYTEPTYVGEAMERGHFDEPLARDLYSETWAPVTEAGFMIRSFGGLKLGYSPDGLVGDDGLIEVKSRVQKLQLKTVLDNEVPAEYMAQIQTGLLVSGRVWCDYLSYCGGMPMYRIRVKPNPTMQTLIIEALTAFEATAAEWVDEYLKRVEGLPMTERIELFGEMEMNL